MTELVAPAFTQNVGQQQITLATVSVPLTVPNNARWAIMKPKVAGVFVSLDASASTVADFLIDAGVAVEITSALADVRLLRAAVGTVVDVWYFG